MSVFNLNIIKQRSEEQWIAGCQRNDSKSQKAIYDKYAPKMLGLCRRYIYQLDLAEDVLSNGFVKIFRNINQYEGKGSFEGWMRKIMVHECLDHIKAKKGIWLDIEDVKPSLDHLHSDEADSDVNVQDLLALIDELPTGYRTVFNLYAIEGYKHQEIAEMLQIAESTSKTQLMKAREALQQKYHEKYSLI